MTTIFTLDDTTPVAIDDAGDTFTELQELKTAIQTSFAGFNSELNAVCTKTGPEIDVGIDDAAAALPKAGGVLTGPVQTTDLEIGHATDTTLSRSAAGVLAVEGNVIPHITASGTFDDTSLTFTGFSVDPTVTFKYKIDQDDLVTVWVTAETAGTSNSAVFSATGWPSALRPSSETVYTSVFTATGYVITEDRGAAFATIATGGVILIERSGRLNGDAWNLTGAKGFAPGTVFQYYKN